MTPFFCVTGRRSFAFRLRPLAQAVVARNERPFYGLEAYRPAAGSDRGLSIAAMAEDHVESVREIQPHGPYLLGGHSAGGLVAYEMARQLRVEGEDVALVVLIDSGFSASMTMRLRRRVLHAQTKWPGKGARARLRRAKHYAVHARRAFSERSGGTRRMLAAGGSAEELEELAAMRSVDNIVRRSFKVQPYDGRVLYVRASELALEGEFADTRDAPDVLRRAVTGPYSVVTVPGTHASLIDPGYVDHVAIAIDEAIDDAYVATTGARA
jgi:thioesterase domain-containing protein